ncbi:MAG: SIS domain-containing protein [Chloroflexota bacterium]|jgi:phosphoheptose isomerase|nr:SIS domain-containing protein [Chloroflexota bacterium]
MHRSLQTLRERYPELAQCVPSIEEAYALLHAAYAAGNKVLICGNGGSAADCEHIVGELMKGYLAKRPLPDGDRRRLTDAFGQAGHELADRLQGALPTISLPSQVSLITAYANDVAPEMIFAQQVYGYGKEGDVLIGISTSGNSANVVHAAEVARAFGLSAIGFTGADGGKLAAVCDVTIGVPYRHTAEIQERHLPIYHVLCEMLEEAFFV